MNILAPFKKRFNKNTSLEISEIEIVEEIPVSTTDKISSIIDEAISNGKFKDMKEQMKNLSESLEDSEVFVFNASTPVLGLLFAVLFVFASFGCAYAFFTGYRLHSYTDYYDNYALYLMGGAAIFIIINIAMIIKIFRERSFSKRFPKYKERLISKNMEYIDDIAAYTAISTKVVTRDLKKAVSCGAIPQGHFGFNNRVFFTSDSSFKIYLTNQEKLNAYYSKELEERHLRNTRDEKINQIVQQGEMHIQNIRNLNEKIKDKGITQKLDRMEKIVSSIFYEVDNNPSYADELGLLLEKYLPMVDKLLNQYLQLGTSVVTGFSLKQAQNQIEDTLANLNDIFEKILNQFYLEKERNILESVLSIKDIVKAEAELNGVPIEDLMKKYS